MTHVTRECCHTLAALVERWSYEARELERRAQLSVQPRGAVQAAGAYRACASDLQRVVDAYRAELPDEEPPQGAA